MRFSAASLEMQRTSFAVRDAIQAVRGPRGAPPRDRRDAGGDAAPSGAAPGAAAVSKRSGAKRQAKWSPTPGGPQDVPGAGLTPDAVLGFVFARICCFGDPPGPSQGPLRDNLATVV